MATSRTPPALAILSAAALAACDGRVAGVFTPAAHPALPQVQSSGGPVLSAPRVQPIAYAADPARADLETFLHTLAGTSWSDTTSEYGVGPLTVLPTLVLPGPAPAAITDAELKQSLLAGTTGAAPAWGAADASTVYLFLTPPGTTVTRAGPLTSCTDFDAFHGEAQIGALTVPYVVGCSCPGFDGPVVTDLQERTIAVSHELVEAATDPFPDSDPAYDGEDPADAVWTLATGGEVADLCQLDLDPYAALPGSAYLVQRSWSNRAAQAGENPCVPAPPGLPYFNAVPALPDTVVIGDGAVGAPGVKIPVGGKRTLAVSLFSSAPMPGPWTVTAMDVNQLDGGKPSLAFALDKSSGQNGDTLLLTITVLAQGPSYGVEPFVLVSALDGRSNLWMGVVGQ